MCVSAQVSYEEALVTGVIDRLSASYVDKRSGTTVSCDKALQLGLIQPIACELLSADDVSLNMALSAYKRQDSRCVAHISSAIK